MTDVTIAVAFGAGLISFVSPCVLPIVPGYLTVITGIDVTSATDQRGQSLGIARHTLLFISGFGLVFVLMGVTASTLGRTLVANQDLATRISGVVILAMGLYLLGSLIAKSPLLYQERRFTPNLQRFGPLAAPVAGVAFGFGWTPCIGPVLTGILALAATSEGAGQGALLLAVYSAGLGVPFLLTGLAFGRVSGMSSWLRGHMRRITVAAAGSMMGFGVLLIFNQLVWVTSQLQNALRVIGLEELIFIG